MVRVLEAVRFGSNARWEAIAFQQFIENLNIVRRQLSVANEIWAASQVLPDRQCPTRKLAGLDAAAPHPYREIRQVIRTIGFN